MKKHALFFTAAIFCLLTAVLISGCNQYHYVYLRSDSYLPDVQKSVGKGYKGKSVVLGDIYNRAANTYITGYYSGAGLMIDNSKLVYETGIVESYFWYCLQRGFAEAGLTVYTTQQAQAGVPVITIYLNSVSDTEFRFTLQFAKTGQPIYEHQYIVKSGPAPVGSPSDDAIMNWSYDTMNKAAEAILNDPGFKKAFRG